MSTEHMKTVWDALHAYRDDCISEGDPANDAQWDDITHAMACITTYLQQRDELQAKCDELHVQVHDFVAASSQLKDLWIELGKVVPEDYDGCMRLEGAMDKFCKIIVIAQAEAIAKVGEK